MENEKNNNQIQGDGNEGSSQNAPRREHMGEIGKDQNIGGGNPSTSTGTETGTDSSGGIEKDTSDGLSE